MSVPTTLVRRVAFGLAWLTGLALFSLQFACRSTREGRQASHRVDTSMHPPNPTPF